MDIGCTDSGGGGVGGGVGFTYAPLRDLPLRFGDPAPESLDVVVAKRSGLDARAYGSSVACSWSSNAGETFSRRGSPETRLHQRSLLNMLAGSGGADELAFGQDTT